MALSNSPEYLLQYDKLLQLIEIFIGNRLEVSDSSSTDDDSHTVQELMKTLFLPSVPIPEKVVDETLTKTLEVSKDISNDESSEYFERL